MLSSMAFWLLESMGSSKVPFASMNQALKSTPSTMLADKLVESSTIGGLKRIFTLKSMSLRKSNESTCAPVVP